MASSTFITAEQYLQSDPLVSPSGEEIRTELINGEVVEVAGASKEHDRLKIAISDLLGIFVREHRELGFNRYVETTFSVTETDTFVPDVCLLAKARDEAETARVFRGAPELVIEIVSPSDTISRTNHKVTACLANGSREVWIIDASERIVDAHTADSLRRLHNPESLTTDLLPGFLLPIRQLLDEAGY
jgi:Uma2 family endonuclease